MDSVIIVIPTYNESKCIKSVLQSWLKEISFIPRSQILIVDGGSKDKTVKIVRSIQKKYPKLILIKGNFKSHGEAIMNGYRYAVSTIHNYVMQIDSDGQVSASDFKKLWNVRKKWKYIVGCRKHRQDPIERIIITNIVKVVNLFLFGKWIKDANSPFRLTKRTYLIRLLDNIPDNTFAPNIFMSIISSKSNHLHHIPISHRSRISGENSIQNNKLLAICMKNLTELIKFKIRHVRAQD